MMRLLCNIWYTPPTLNQSWWCWCMYVKSNEPFQKLTSRVTCKLATAPAPVLVVVTAASWGLVWVAWAGCTWEACWAAGACWPWAAATCCCCCSFCLCIFKNSCKHTNVRPDISVRFIPLRIVSFRCYCVETLVAYLWFGYRFDLWGSSLPLLQLQDLHLGELWWQHTWGWKTVHNSHLWNSHRFQRKAWVKFSTCGSLISQWPNLCLHWAQSCRNYWRCWSNGSNNWPRRYGDHLSRSGSSSLLCVDNLGSSCTSRLHQQQQQIQQHLTQVFCLKSRQSVGG